MHPSALAIDGPVSGFGRSPAGVRGGLGKLIAGSGDCDVARARVARLRALFEQLVSAGRIKAEAWEPAVESLEVAMKAADPWIEFFNCSAALEVGERAVDLADRMARAAGVASPGLPDKGSEATWLGWGIAGGVVLVLVILYGAMRARGVSWV